MIAAAKLNESSSISANIYDFLLEVNSVLKTEPLKEIIKNYKEQFPQSEKYFIISNFDKINDKTKAFTLFKSYLKIFGKDAALKTIVSDYEINCFGGLPYFNWIVILLLQIDSKTDMNKFEMELAETGVNKNELINAILESNDSILSQILLLLKSKKILDKESAIFKALLKEFLSSRERRQAFYIEATTEEKDSASQPL